MPSPSVFTAGWVHRSLNFANEFSRVASYDSEVRDVLCDDTTSTNDAASPYANTWENHYIPSNPAVLSDMYFSSQLWSLRAVAHHGIEWVSG